jgi:hypothetical protein
MPTADSGAQWRSQLARRLDAGDPDMVGMYLGE